jgi:hypothetical protein
METKDNHNTEDYNTEDYNIWYKNPYILVDTFYNLFLIIGLDLKNINISKYEKSNYIIIFSILFSIIILSFSLNKKYLLIPIFLVFYSIFIIKNNFIKIKNVNNKCQEPTYINPFMNYTIGDAISNPNRLKGCNYLDVKKDVKKKFRSGLYSDLTNLWGKQISDINFYTMPNSNIVNNSIGFANWCYINNNKSGKCKIDGSDCKINDNTYFISRIINKNIK